MTVFEYLVDKYGASMSGIVNAKVVPVLPSPTLICIADPQRYAVYMSNMGTTSVSIGLYPYVSTTVGWLLQASGGSIIIQAESDLMLPTKEIYGISLGGEVSIYVVEICF